MIYAYFEGCDPEGYEWFFPPTLAAGAIPTNDGTLLWVGHGAQSDPPTRQEPEAQFWHRFRDAAPELAEPARNATRTSRWHRFPGQIGYIRQSFGPGWALVGDAAHFNDPLSAHGLTDALRDAELLARAVDTALRGSASFEDALAHYQRIRDELTVPMFRAVDRLASYEWDTNEARELLLVMSAIMKSEVEMLLSFDQEPVAA